MIKSEYPRPDFRRERWLNLNGEWDFKLLPDGAGEDAPVNFDRKITVPFSWTSPLSGVAENVKGIGWYRRVARFDTTERVFLCVGAADYITDVYVNGTHLARHQGGYNQFDTDVTDVWNKGDNEIIIRCEDFRRETQTYGKQGYGDIQGIWQTVWLEARPESRIESFRVTTKIDGNIEITAAVSSDAPFTAAFDGRIYEGTCENGTAKVSFKIENPRLWSPESPNLYEGTLRLGHDIIHTYFGIREIEAKDGRILLNGKPIYINGTLDQAFNPKGHFTYPSDADMRAEAWRLKRLGLNMARIHIKSEEPRKLYWMDKLGILIMQDIPCFWGEPNAEARATFEAEWPREFDRDFNHPCIFAWVMFNETWGLFTKVGDEKKYLPETQEWVRSVYRAAKANDPTRIIEDNSVCNYDHVETDINTWHFYINGYNEVRDHIRGFMEKAFPGSAYNFIGENRQTNAPVMNSECGMVWGVDGSAGDSDIAWQYHYMLNEYRLQHMLNGFIFTEFHDVVNEFNGYYRIDDTDKDFGYSYFTRGMKIKDLHAQDFLALDCPPCRTVSAAENVSVPCAISSFSNCEKPLSVKWELWRDGVSGRETLETGAFDIPAHGIGTTRLADINITMPETDSLCVLSTYLTRGNEIISRNFTTFDVDAGETYIPVADGVSTGFEYRWTALGGEKLCLGGAGEVSWNIPVKNLPEDITVTFEASSKRVLQKDAGEKTGSSDDGSFMRGYLVDRGSFKNSYFMTDEDDHPTNLEILINGVRVKTEYIENDFADARGVLSWQYQPKVRALDEAGSYGKLISFNIPSRLIPEIAESGAFTLTLKADNGLALYGRKCGKYATGLKIEY